MAITSTDQLTPEMREAATPAPAALPFVAQQPTAAGPMPTPNAPVSDVPGPVGTLPAAMTPPEVPAPDLTHAEKIGGVAAQVPTPPGPGGWAKKLVASATSALQSMQSGLSDGLQDYASAQVPPGNHGLLGGIAAQQNAKAQRLQAAQVAQTAEDRARGLIALTSVQTLHQQTLLHAASDAANHEDIANGKAFIKLYTEDQSALGLEPAKILFPDITEQQYRQNIVSGAIDPTQTHFQPTGSFQPTGKDGKPMTDAAGMPMLQKTYTVVSNLPDLKLRAGKTLDLINSVPGIHFDAGQVLTGAQAASLIQQGQNMHAVAAKIAFDQEEAGVKKSQLDLTKAQIDSNARLDADPAFLKASAHLPDLATLSEFVTGQLPSGRMVPEVVNGKPTGRQIPALGPGGQLEIAPESLAYAQSHPTGLTDLRNRYGWTKEGESVYDKTLESQRKKAEEAKEKAAEDAQKAKEKAEGNWSIQEDENGNSVLLNSKTGGSMPAPAGMVPKGTAAKNETVVIGTDPTTGKQVQVSQGEAKKLGLVDINKADAADVGKTLSARHWITLAEKPGDQNDSSTMGILPLIDKLDKAGKLGTVASRWNEFMAGKYGAGDPDIEALRAKMGLGTTLLMQAHVGNRGGSYMLEHFEDLANQKKMDAQTLRSGIKSELDYMKDKAMLPTTQQSGKTPVQLPPAAPGTVNIQDSKGGYHNIPQGGLALAQKRDPKLTVIQ